jgi:hypothetical protein
MLTTDQAPLDDLWAREVKTPTSGKTGQKWGTRRRSSTVRFARGNARFVGRAGFVVVVRVRGQECPRHTFKIHSFWSTLFESGLAGEL